MKILLIALMSILLISCYKENEEDLFEPVTTDLTPIDTGGIAVATFKATIQPLIQRKCTDRSCHGSPNEPGGFAPLNTYNEIKLLADNGKLKNRAIVLKDMPEAGNPPLSTSEIEELRYWLDNGALNN